MSTDQSSLLPSGSPHNDGNDPFDDVRNVGQRLPAGRSHARTGKFAVQMASHGAGDLLDLSGYLELLPSTAIARHRLQSPAAVS